jgi:hypothetical protein
LGFLDVQTKPWQTYYDLVWARKPTAADPIPAAPTWPGGLVCPGCGVAADWLAEADELTCTACGAIIHRRQGVWHWRGADQ